ILLETYRECLRDVFDLPGLTGLLRQVRDRRVRVVTADTRTPSPFASSLLFAYVANFIYDGDSPLAERRAQALSVDQGQLRELLEPVEDALGDLVSRYARTHGPFRPEDVARRLGLGVAPVQIALERLEEQERVLQGEFLPAALAAARYPDGTRGREWCD